MYVKYIIESALMSTVTDIKEEDLARLVALFYGRVRKDPDIGPIFNDAVEDWPAHLVKLTNFWHSVMLTSGRYKGNPMVAHMRHKRIKPEHFDRWLALWNVATAEVMPPAVAATLQAKAARIGESLKLALFFKLDPAAGSRRAASIKGE